MCKISIIGSGLNIEREISDELAKEIAVIVLTRGDVVTREIVTPEPKIKKAPKNELSDFTIFTQQHNARRSCELVACLGVYLDKNGSPVFTKAQYRDYFTEVRNKPSTNAPTDLKWALDANWISIAGEDKYKITSVGKKVVKEKFPNTVKGSTRRKK